MVVVVVVGDVGGRMTTMIGISIMMMVLHEEDMSGINSRIDPITDVSTKKRRMKRRTS
jgi:hypothetical protein